MRSIFVVTATILLSACTGSTDPKTATFFDNLGNLSSGEYDRQIADKQAEAAGLQQESAARQQQVAALEQQRARNASAISGARRDLASAKAAAANDPGQLAQLDQLTVQLNSAEAAERRGADPAATRSELKRIQDAIRAISS
jgi:septal ring factor EnvC (AmiA/AmiB activator)